MRMSARYIFSILAGLLAASCDLHPRIVSALVPDSHSSESNTDMRRASSGVSKSDYGNLSEESLDANPPSGHSERIDTTYGQDFTPELYGSGKADANAKVSDYYAPPATTTGAPADVAAAEFELDEDDANDDASDDANDDVLLVPARVAKSDKPPAIVAPVNDTITVAKGDTLYSIAKNNNVPLRDLLDENKLSAPYNISIGQKLRIPGARVHTVIAGDTLYSVSRKYSVDLNSLAETNGIGAPYALAVGQKLRLPASITETAAMISPSVPSRGATTAVKKTTSADVKPSLTGPVKTTAVAAQTIVDAPKTGGAGGVKKLPAAAARTGTKFSWPVRGKIVSGFGAKKNGLYNDGINIEAAAGTTVKAAENGVIAYAGNELKGLGNLVIIQHSGGWMTVYSHMDTLSVKRGKKVVVGEKIGTVGKTGQVTTPQLHFEIRKGTKAYNPTANLKK